MFDVQYRDVFEQAVNTLHDQFCKDRALLDVERDHCLSASAYSRCSGTADADKVSSWDCVCDINLLLLSRCGLHRVLNILGYRWREDTGSEVN